MSETWHPRPYHPAMVEHVIDHPRGMLFVPMGFGKSSAVLCAIDALMLGGTVRRTLVIAPLRVARSTWPEEIRKWANFSHLSVAVCIGDERERRAALAARADVTTINYENIEWLIRALGDQWPFDLVVCDEVTKCKSARTRQGGRRASALLRAMAAHPSCRFVGLTGTPTPNGLQDLYGMMLFVDMGFRLGRSYSAFENRWFAFQNANDAVRAHKTFVKRIVMPHAQDEIQDLIKDVCLTLAVEDWFDIDEPIVNTVYVDLPAAARKLYARMEREYFMELDGHEIEALSAAAKSTKLLQCVAGAAYVEGASVDWVVLHDEKLDALRSIVEETNGAPVLVAYSFKSDLARILKAFPQARHLDKKSQTIDDWNDGKIPMLVAHPASAGHGLNLARGGNTLVFFSAGWNLEERLQIIERIGPVRQKQAGLERPVFIHQIIARNTIDEVVLARVQTKRSVQDLLLAALNRFREAHDAR